jgi:hypothetical protein
LGARSVSWQLARNAFWEIGSVDAIRSPKRERKATTEARLESIPAVWACYGQWCHVVVRTCLAWCLGDERLIRRNGAYVVMR